MVSTVPADRRLRLRLEHAEEGFGRGDHLPLLDRIAFFDQQCAGHLVGVNPELGGDLDRLHQARQRGAGDNRVGRDGLARLDQHVAL